MSLSRLAPPGPGDRFMAITRREKSDPEGPSTLPPAANSSADSASSATSSRPRTSAARSSRPSGCTSSTRRYVHLSLRMAPPSPRLTSLMPRPTPTPRAQEASTVTSALQADARLLATLRAELEQSLADLTKTTLLIEGYQAGPGSQKAQEARVASQFPYEYFRRKADEMKDRVRRYRATMDVSVRFRLTWVRSSKAPRGG